MQKNALFSTARLGNPIPKEDTRSLFEQDFDRIIFSYPFRRLQDKTQVFPLPEYDFVHTRLTHSLEVSSVARSLGKNIGVHWQKTYENSVPSANDIAVICATAALAHDIGNPPFGHAGESAISYFFKNLYTFSKENFTLSEPQWEELKNFEGNAQGFRLLTSGIFGLKLTAATLASFTKYPRPAYFPEKNVARKSHQKYGYFLSEEKNFDWMMDQCQLRQSNGSCIRHPLNFLVEAADDICYLIIDLEDACRLGWIPFDDLVQLLHPIFEWNTLASASKKYALAETTGFLRASVINRLVEACTEVFIENERKIFDGDFDQSLLDQTVYGKAIQQIKIYSINHIYQSRLVREKEIGGYAVINGLLEQYLQIIDALDKNEKVSFKDHNLLSFLPDFTMNQWQIASNTYERFRLLLDFISSLTDRYAVSLYKKMKGMDF